MTAAEIEADIAQQAPGGGPRDTDERAAAHAIRKETRDEILSARAADPAGWAMRDDDVAAAFVAARANPTRRWRAAPSSSASPCSARWGLRLPVC